MGQHKIDTEKKKEQKRKKVGSKRYYVLPGE
jgi:hypothetical protein